MENGVWFLGYPFDKCAGLCLHLKGAGAATLSLFIQYSIVITILSFVIAIGHFTLMVYGYSSLEKLTTLENISVFGVLP